MQQKLNWKDISAVVAYFVLVIAIAIWSSLKRRRSGSNADNFLIARGTINFVPIAASIFASNIGATHFLGISGSAAVHGIGVNNFEMNSGFALMILAWVFLPVYFKAGVYTMPEYINKRFGGERIRIILSVLQLIISIFMRISTDLYAGSLFISLYLGVNMYISIAAILTIAAVFTMTGGAHTVIYTDTLQAVFMLIGAIYLLTIGLFNFNGFDEIFTKYGYAASKATIFSNTTCGLVKSNYLSFVRSYDDGDFPWPAMSMGFMVIAIFYFCNDQVIVQRTLAAKNLTHAKAACLLASYLKFLPFFIMIIPGMMSRVLFKDDIACSDPVECFHACKNELGCSGEAFPRLVMYILPVGARGFIFAVIISAVTSSLTSIFNSSSVIFTMDIWHVIRKRRSKDRELIVVSRVFILVLVALSIIWVIIIEKSQSNQLFAYVNSILSFIASPITSLYIQAVLFKRINEKGAFWSLVIGIAIGMTRFIWQYSYPDLPCTYGRPVSLRPAIIDKFHYMHFAVFLFFITFGISWVISILTKPLPPENIKNLTLFSLDETTNDFNHPVDESSDIDLERKRSFLIPQKNLLRICYVNMALISAIWGFFVTFFYNYD